MARAEYGGQKPPVILTLSFEEARALLDDLSESCLSEQTLQAHRALRELLDS